MKTIQYKQDDKVGYLKWFQILQKQKEFISVL